MDLIRDLYRDLSAIIQDKLAEHPEYKFDNVDVRNWDWQQIGNPASFRWQIGSTPLSDLAVNTVN